MMDQQEKLAQMARRARLAQRDRERREQLDQQDQQVLREAREQLALLQQVQQDQRALLERMVTMELPALRVALGAQAELELRVLAGIRGLAVLLAPRDRQD